MSQAQDGQGANEQEMDARKPLSGHNPSGSGAGAGAEAATGLEAELRSRAEAGSAAVDSLAGHAEAGGAPGETAMPGDGPGHPRVKQEPNTEDASFRHRSPEVSSSSMVCQRLYLSCMHRRGQVLAPEALDDQAGAC